MVAIKQISTYSADHIVLISASPMSLIIKAGKAMVKQYLSRFFKNGSVRKPRCLSIKPVKAIINVGATAFILKRKFSKSKLLYLSE